MIRTTTEKHESRASVMQMHQEEQDLTIQARPVAIVGVFLERINSTGQAAIRDFPISILRFEWSERYMILQRINDTSADVESQDVALVEDPLGDCTRVLPTR
jgi:hypothetical protein